MMRTQPKSRSTNNTLIAIARIYSFAYNLPRMCLNSALVFYNLFVFYFNLILAETVPTTIFLSPSMVKTWRKLCPAVYASRFGYCPIKSHTFFRTIFCVAPVINNIKFNTTILTNYKNPSILFHLSAPFDGLCNKVGRVAKVSTFSRRFITPSLSRINYTTEV